MTLLTECLNKLDWWNNHMLKWNAKSLIKKEIDLTIDSDASLTGWGPTVLTSQQEEHGCVKKQLCTSTVWNC